MEDSKKKSSIEQSNGRRDFMKTGALGVFGAMVAGRILSRSEKAQAADAKKPELVKTSDPMAQSLGYTEDAKKVDTKKFPKRAGKAGEKQFCYNCQFYQEKKNPKDSKNAACTIFGGKAVLSHAWCNSWTQDPNVKD